MKRSILFILFSFFFSLTSFNQTWEWGKKYGITNYDQAFDIVSDYNGDVFIAGRCSYGIEFETDTLISPCNYLAKFDSLGNELWVKLIPNSNYGATWTQLDVDSDNNIYIYDKLSLDTLVLDQDTLYASKGKFFLAKFDPQGNIIWSKEVCKTTSTHGNYLRIGDFDISPNDELHLNGSFADTAIFDQDTLFMENGRVFVVKYDADGNHLMSTQFGGWHYYILVDGYGIAADDQGCTYVSGRSELGGLYDGDTVWCQQYFSDMFIVKFSATGEMLWHKHVTGINPGTGGIADEVCTFGLDWDNNGHVYIGGYYNSDIYFEDSTIIHPYSKAYWSGFLAKYDTTGNFEWVKYEDKLYFLGVDCDLSGNVYTTGLFRDSINFWGTSYQSITVAGDAFVGRFDLSGNVNWSLQNGGDVNWNCISVAKCNVNKVYTAGHYSGYPMELGGINLPNPTQEDIFIAGIQNDNPGNDCSGIGFSESSDIAAIRIYPNPTTGEVYISYADDLDQLTVYNIAGEMMFSSNNLNAGTRTVDMTHLPNGMYIIQIVKGDQVVSERVVKL